MTLFAMELDVREQNLNHRNLNHHGLQTNISSNVTNGKNELKKTVKLTSFQKPQYHDCNKLQSSSIIFIRAIWFACFFFKLMV